MTRQSQTNSLRQERRLSCEHLEERCMLATWFVDPTGNDLSGVGSISEPYKTISRARTFAQPGDTVAVRAGVYREEVSLFRSGTEGNPITFEAYNGEDVLVTTTDILSGWTQHSGNIYKATFDSDLRGRNGMTLFVDGQLTREAHWSNLGSNVNTLSNAQWATMNGGDLNSITDTALLGMPDDLWNGAFVWAQTSNFTMEARRIADFDGSTGRITVSSPFSRDPNSGFRFLIYDDLDALDAPGEWFFDESSNTLYLWAPGGVDPDTLTVEVKVRDDGFDLNGHDYIHIKDIDFRGGDLNMAGSHDILLQGAHIVAPDRGFGPEGSGGALALQLDGGNNIIRDNEVEEVWGTFARLDDGDNNELVNNHFHHMGYNNSNAAVVSLSANSEETLVSHNTIEHIGRAAIGGVGGIRSVIQYNDVSRTAQMTADVGAIYLLNNSLGNSIIHHNVFHDITAHLSNGIYLDNNASDVVIHHNVSYNINAFGGKINLPNSYVLYFNNTHYNSGRIDAWGPSTSSDASTGSKFFNNIYSTLDADLTNSSDPAEESNNFATSSSANFVNAAAGDFRLLANSAAVDAGREITGITDGFAGSAPDAGALELGEAMWEFGHDFAAPPTPSYQWAPVPFSNRVANPSFDQNLNSWTGGIGSPSWYRGNAWNYRLDALATVGVGSLELGPGDHVEQTIGSLLPNTTYEVGTKARFVKDLQLESYDSASGIFTTGNYRDETYIGGVDAGEWVRFDNVDFGTGSSLYNRIEIGTQQNSALNVELRLGSPAGQLIGTLNVPSRGEPWFMTREDISSVTGTHDLYVIFQDDGGSIGKFDRIRLLDTNVSESVTLGVKNYDGLGSTSTTSIGGAYWSSVPEKLMFTTGPNADSATIFIEKQGGIFNGYVDVVTFTGDAFQVPVTTLELLIDPAGRGMLTNRTEEVISFDGYAISDSSPSLKPTSWFSLQDQNYEDGLWDEAGPTTTFIAELNPSGFATLSPGESVYLGGIANPSLMANVSFEYIDFAEQRVVPGVVKFEDTGLPTLDGDYDDDSFVSGADFLLWQQQSGTDVASFAAADGNGSGQVDTPDLILWSANYGQTSGSLSSLASPANTRASEMPSIVSTKEIETGTSAVAEMASAIAFALSPSSSNDEQSSDSELHPYVALDQAFSNGQPLKFNVVRGDLGRIATGNIKWAKPKSEGLNESMLENEYFSELAFESWEE